MLKTQFLDGTLNKAIQDHVISSLRGQSDNAKKPSKYAKYTRSPVKFGMQVLGDIYTPEIQRLMLSVRDNPVTVAKTGNAVGKVMPLLG